MVTFILLNLIGLLVARALIVGGEVGSGVPNRRKSRAMPAFMSPIKTAVLPAAV